MKHKILPYVGVGGGIATLAAMAIFATIARRSEVPTHHLHMAENVAPRAVAERTGLREGLAPPPVQVPTVASLPKSPEYREEVKDMDPEPAVSTEDQAAYAETTYDQQALDARWARDSEAAIGNGLRAQLGTAVIESVGCRESLCRAQLRHNDAAQFSEFLDRMIGNANGIWKGPIASYRVSVAPNGTIENAVYFAKEGTAIPRL